MRTDNAKGPTAHFFTYSNWGVKIFRTIQTQPHAHLRQFDPL